MKGPNQTLGSVLVFIKNETKFWVRGGGGVGDGFKFLKRSKQNRKNCTIILNFFFCLPLIGIVLGVNWRTLGPLFFQDLVVFSIIKDQILY